MLKLNIRPRGNAGNVNITSSLLPGNVFDFRTCEGVISENRDFGLFTVHLKESDWSISERSLSYEWRYDAGIRVSVSIETFDDFLKLGYKVANETDQTLKRVQIHPCIPTTEAPAFWPPPERPPNGAETHFYQDRRLGQRPCRSVHFDLFTRLHLWTGNKLIRYCDLQSAKYEVHLSLMRAGESPFEWAWWNNDPATFDLPFIALTSRDSKFVLAYGFESSIWSSANVGDDRACFHLFPFFGDIGPGRESESRGLLYLFQGTPDGAKDRFLTDITGVGKDK